MTAKPIGESDVLIVGAGPTGLVLALWLTRMKARVRIVDKAPEPGQTSRAVGVQARTLEQYRQVDLAREVVDAGFQARALNLWVKGERKGRLELGVIGQGLSPFPYLLVYPQDEHEKLLIARLAALGVEVERPTELVELDREDNRVVARLRGADGATEEHHADYVAGCDGARSFVREALQLGYPGGTYAHLFYVADVEASGPTMNGEAHFALDDDSNFLACLALGPGHVRLIGTIREEALRKDQILGWDDVSKKVIERLRLQIARVNWLSTYRVHHRVASAFRVGRVLLLGDAAHIHSPVGGQGMNTGIGDAINLAWKLAAVLHRRASASIVDSYEEERLPFAQRLVHSTDRAFELLSADSRLAAAVRIGVVPQMLTTLFHLRSVRRLLFNTVSQININYRGSRLSEGRAARVHGGDRLPWVPSSGRADNFEPLRSLGWQTHVYGEPSRALATASAARRAPLHVLPWEAGAEEAGLARDAAYLVRPDGYVALAAESAHAAERLERYFEEREIRLGEGGAV